MLLDSNYRDADDRIPDGCMELYDEATDVVVLQQAIASSADNTEEEVRKLRDVAVRRAQFKLTDQGDGVKELSTARGSQSSIVRAKKGFTFAEDAIAPTAGPRVMTKLFDKVKKKQTSDVVTCKKNSPNAKDGKGKSPKAKDVDDEDNAVLFNLFSDESPGASNENVPTVKIVTDLKMNGDTSNAYSARALGRMTLLQLTDVTSLRNLRFSPYRKLKDRIRGRLLVKCVLRYPTSDKFEDKVMKKIEATKDPDELKLLSAQIRDRQITLRSVDSVMTGDELNMLETHLTVILEAFTAVDNIATALCTTSTAEELREAIVSSQHQSEPHIWTCPPDVYVALVRAFFQEDLQSENFTHARARLKSTSTSMSSPFIDIGIVPPSSKLSTGDFQEQSVNRALAVLIPKRADCVASDPPCTTVVAALLAFLNDLVTDDFGLATGDEYKSCLKTFVCLLDCVATARLPVAEALAAVVAANADTVFVERLQLANRTFVLQLRAAVGKIVGSVAADEQADRTFEELKGRMDSLESFQDVQFVNVHDYIVSINGILADIASAIELGTASFAERIQSTMTDFESIRSYIHIRLPDVLDITFICALKDSIDITPSIVLARPFIDTPIGKLSIAGADSFNVDQLARSLFADAAGAVDGSTPQSAFDDSVNRRRLFLKALTANYMYIWRSQLYITLARMLSTSPCRTTSHIALFDYASSAPTHVGSAF